MRVASVQLRFYRLSRVSVLPRESVELTMPKDPAPVPKWDGINIQSDVEFAWADGQTDPPTSYAVRLHVRILNDGEHKAPYDIDLEVVGYFDLLGKFPLDIRGDVAKVNGASILYGILREILSSLTARFPRGELVLPGVNFFDLKSEAAQKATSQHAEHLGSYQKPLPPSDPSLQ